ncbi:hypothetical protein [Methylorubrum extorquens]|uniref:Uncharacterized protein n=1 Tax=Methylorubrum extorquens (strain CM4 / NCIMB 13688) TaxID=440085 RepID=B7L3R9_METC4|nr:hypothetical protein [Methylorubrum extorquens]ACK86477.1 hypothetical protein Mchl_5766 [Methylorubrum extorquens CM4]
MSLAHLRRRLERLESRHLGAAGLPWVWIVAHDDEELERKTADMIEAGKMQLGQSRIVWRPITPSWSAP